MKSILFLTIFFLLFTGISCTQEAFNTEKNNFLSNIAQSSTAEEKSNACTTMDFHYLIISDNQMSSTNRQIEVFLDEKAFSEENLKKLFRYLSDKYPDTNNSANK